MALVLAVIFICFCEHAISENSRKNYTFPDNFKFGTSTASYQIEGAWKEDGKGESIWDNLVHNHNSKILDRSNGDVACDSYHRYMEDIELMKTLGAETYRFSISWSRILPTGYSNKVNPAGIKYYNDLIDALIKEGIEPSVTMYHWDLPQKLQEIGGWVNPFVADLFLDYANMLFESFGDRVKVWSTINEPEQVCVDGYELAIKAPAQYNPGISVYLCSHTIIQAHAKVWKLYDTKYRSKQKGKIGMVLNGPWYGPYDENNPSDREASERRMQFQFGWFADPLIFGDYPEVMKTYVATNSKHQGFLRSRLPEFTEEQKEMNKETLDFIGINIYTAKFIKNKPGPSNSIKYYDDSCVSQYNCGYCPTTNSSWLQIAPFAMRNNLNWIHNRYNHPEIMVTENGMSEHALNDTVRVKYYNDYLYSLLEAVHEDKVNVTAYTAWSLLDNFEWMVGYTERFGLVYVDFKSENKTRIPRSSFYNFQKIIQTRRIPD